jgi:WhiB family redox-sensing transcriptional regulator
VTARQPRHRSPAGPAPFATRWRALAACRGADLNLFFPGRGESAGPARRVCAGCPVREPCLDYALTHGITHGVWGGLAERDRRALRSHRIAAARRERNEAIAAAAVAGYSQAEIGRAFGLTRTSVGRVLAGGVDEHGPS